MKELNNNTILTLFLVSIVVSLGGAYITINSVNKLAGTTFLPLTGFVTNPTGNASVTINTASSIKFSVTSVAFGSGNVNTTGGFTNCTLDTYGTARGCASFTSVGTPTGSKGFEIENDGNTNLSVELVSNATAAQFFGTSDAYFAWNVSVNETGSCVNGTNPGNNVVAPNTTASGCGGSVCGAIFENITTTPATGKNVCPRLLYTDSSDSLRIDLNITIPYDAPTGSKGAQLTVTGSRNPVT